MSDQSSPPKPKPGSLRDRIAAFETKGGAAPATHPGPPPPRPKPGGLQWKPKPSSPPTSPDHPTAGERKPPSTAGMSASDAMESIGRGGSLKERMAALQGKGGFGGLPPPVAPKPNVERPKWKSPPTVPLVSSEDESKEGIAHVDLNREGDAVAHEGDSGDPDPEEEEGQRRAAIAARMARLGGARFGLGPPIVAPKPVVRKSEPAPPALVAKDEMPVDQPTVVKESSEALVTSLLHESPAAVSPVPEAIAETECKDESESPLPVAARAPTSMPVPAGPRRAAPPRKKSKNAPTTALPEPPVDEAEGVSVQSPPITYELPVIVDHAVHDASLTTEDSQKGIDEVAEPVEATYDEHLSITADVEQRPMPPSVPTVATHEPVEEPEKQEAEEEPVESADSHVEEESMHTADDQEVPFEQSSRSCRGRGRRRGSASPASCGQIQRNTGRRFHLHPLFQQDTNLFHPSNTTLLSRTSRSTKTMPRSTRMTKYHAHRDVASYTEEQGDGYDGHRLPSPEFSEERSVRQEQGTVPTQEAEALPASAAAPLEADPVARSTTADIEHDTSKDEAAEDDMAPPRITRPIPPPPVNFRSKPTPPTSPFQAVRADEEERPASPDIPPRPVPPPGRSGSVTEDVLSPPPRRSIPPPPRRTSVRVTDPQAETPSLPPPAPTSPRPINCMPVTPPIITTLAVPEQVASEEHENEEETSESGTPQPKAQEDEASARRRAIADRMARLGGIRFGAPPPMNPLSRPPLPAAPPPTSIPPDETESEGKEEEGERAQGEEEENEAARKQRIAAKLAGMGGMRFGMLPPAAGLLPASARRLVARQEDSESEDAMPPVPVPAPPQRHPPTRKPPPPIEVPMEQESEQIGRASRGTSDDGVQVEAEESEMEEVHYSDAEVPVVSEEENAPVLPPPRRPMQTPRSAEALPTPPPRMTSRSPPPGRPPIPMIPAALLGRRPSAATGSSSRQTSLDESSLGETPTISGRSSENAVRPQSEYVMVEVEDPDEDNAPALPPRLKSTRSPVRSIPLPPPPPPSAIDPPETLASSAQWELPSIPHGVEFGEASEMASSRWSEDSTAVHVPPPVPSSHPRSRGPFSKVGLPSSTTTVSVSVAGSGAGSGSGSGRKSVDQQQQQQLTTDELMAIWGKVGVQVAEVATSLFDKSKRMLVGDGSYAGFVRAVLAQVPGAMMHHPTGSAGEHDWGYTVYAQTGNAVQRRVSDILPGDVIAFWDAKLKGHKGLHAYTQTAGAGAGEGGGPLVGVVSEFDGKKSKVRVWQANQHVGQQTVEIVSYRLEDMKSGQVKVYRVLEA
ncbi:hypothetical protein J3R82DRAFT_9370 [Butyriboletus roseoflavus]|nr:hypothetical protein J3R82DRAFT_9370 [Butyriboletus roseoflavus]